jgi:hypothetical protein
LGLAAFVVVALGGTAAAAYFYLGRSAQPEPLQKGPLATLPPRSYLARSRIEYFCSRCHAYPPAEIFPRSAWKQEVEQAYHFFEDSTISNQVPPLADVIKYYEDGAPLELELPSIVQATGHLPVRLVPTPSLGCPEIKTPAISNVNLVQLFDSQRRDVLACDLRAGVVMTLQPYAPTPVWRVLARVPNPAHAEVVDLDGDGIKDILVANLGSPVQTNAHTGSVVWLRGNRQGGFTPITLLSDVGRVADVQAGDFRGVGKLDLVVAVFGWRKTGEVIYLENQTSDWAHPVFVPRVLDQRHGAIHVAVGDLNGDGRPDLVVLLSQEHETIVAFVNEGGGRFRKETIYSGPHPAYGSTGIQLVDLDGDGKLDLLYTNGFSNEQPYLLKPYHGVQWLQNQGKFPFVHHALGTLYGAYRAVAADFRGKGVLDIVAVSYLPQHGFPDRQERQLDAVIYLEQTAPGKFERHTLETGTCDHLTCAAGDIFGTGKVDLVIGNLVAAPGAAPITIWERQ